MKYGNAVVDTTLHASRLSTSKVNRQVYDEQARLRVLCGPIPEGGRLGTIVEAHLSSDLSLQSPRFSPCSLRLESRPSTSSGDVRKCYGKAGSRSGAHLKNHQQEAWAPTFKVQSVNLSRDSPGSRGSLSPNIDKCHRSHSSLGLRHVPQKHG